MPDITNRDSIRLVSLLLARVVAESTDDEITIIASAIDKLEISNDLLDKYMNPQWRTT